jgi:hypothetical protein
MATRPRAPQYGNVAAASIYYASASYYYTLDLYYPLSSSWPDRHEPGYPQWCPTAATLALSHLTLSLSLSAAALALLSDGVAAAEARELRECARRRRSSLSGVRMRSDDDGREITTVLLSDGVAGAEAHCFHREDGAGESKEAFASRSLEERRPSTATAARWPSGALTSRRRAVHGGTGVRW